MRRHRRNYYGYSGMGSLDEIQQMMMDIYEETYPTMYQQLKDAFFESYYAEASKELSSAKEKTYESLYKSAKETLKSTLISKSKAYSPVASDMHNLFIYYTYYAETKIDNDLRNLVVMDANNYLYFSDLYSYNETDNYYTIHMYNVNVGSYYKSNYSEQDFLSIFNANKEFLLSIFNECVALQKTYINYYITHKKFFMDRWDAENVVVSRKSTYNITKNNVTQWVKQFTDSNLNIKSVDEMLDDIKNTPVPSQKQDPVEQVIQETVLQDDTIPLTDTNVTQPELDATYDLPDPDLVNKVEGKTSTLTKLGLAAGAAFLLLKG